MILLFPGFLVLNTIFLLHLKAYQIQEQMPLVNALSVSENLIMALFSAAMAGFLGADGVWLSFPASEIICLLVVAGSVIVRVKRLPFSLSDWMKLDESFGASPDECIEFRLRSMEEVVNLSIAIIDFCQAHGIDYRRSMVAGLCVEEMAGNVIQYGFLPGEDHSVDVRVVVRDKLTIRVRDDCRAFDPQKRLEQFDPEDPSKNVGIRMIARMAEEMNYQGSAGINTLLIKV
jgi:anti-sigma regulatory factor (Ser/Thr protein kinase)